MKTPPKYSPLRWEKEYDDNDNTIWTAASCTCYEEAAPCYYKLQQRLEGDAIIWFDQSDSELCPDEATWNSANEAKDELEKRNMETFHQVIAEFSLADCKDED